MLEKVDYRSNDIMTVDQIIPAISADFLPGQPVIGCVIVGIIWSTVIMSLLLYLLSLVLNRHIFSPFHLCKSFLRFPRVLLDFISAMQRGSRVRVISSRDTSSQDISSRTTFRPEQFSTG